MRGISTRGTGCRQSLRCNAQKNTRQRLSGSADSPRVIFLRSEKPGERGGAPNSAEIHIHARKGAGPPAGKTYTQKLPQRGAGLFPTLPAISSKGARYIKHCRQSARRHCTGRQESPRPLPWGCFSASACILSVYGKSQKTPAQKGRPGAIRPEITKIMSKKTQSKKSAPSALYFYRNCDNFSTLQTLYISPILYRKRAPTILISRI